MTPTPETPSDWPRPTVKLVGEDGNAFSIIGRCRRAGKAAGWDDEKLTAFSEEAMAGDYDHLLQTAVKYFEVE